ncbi:hypothetical protein CapIbe_018007 [Capra ibex]
MKPFSLAAPTLILDSEVNPSMLHRTFLSLLKCCKEQQQAEDPGGKCRAQVTSGSSRTSNEKRMNEHKLSKPLFLCVLPSH